MLSRVKFITKLLGLFCLAGLAGMRFPVIAGQDWNAGPLFDQFSLTLEPGHRDEAVGPLFYSQEKDTERTIAVPPIFSHVTDSAIDSEEFDFLYPVMTYDRYGREFRWQFFQLLSLAGGQNQQEIPRSRFTVFPFYFQQRSPDPSQNYTAFLPIYGHLKQRLFRDEIFFVLFPLYSETRKRDVVTDNYLFPFFHLRHGDALHGWQFWPLIGAEQKAITTRTNGFGDVETIGGHEKSFVLWPIWLDQRTGIGTDHAKTNTAMLPLLSLERSPQRDSTSVIWPFFNYVDDREKHYREWQSPWPLIVFARGEGKTTSRVWPLFSQASSTNLTSSFYLWPVYKYNRVHSGALDRDRTRILLFLYSEVSEKNLETGKARERTDFWPIFAHRRDFNGNTRLQLLAPLEPILPNNRGIERNWSPLWSIWRAEKNPTTGDASQSLLWNLYRRERTGTAKKCSLLFGLFQYQSDVETKRWRLFYIPLTKSHKHSDHVPEHR